MAQTQWPGTPDPAPSAAPPAVPGRIYGGPPNPPPGYRAAGQGLEPIPGGPANPPPTGYRYKADGGLEAIPGGPADPGRNAAGASDDPAIRAQATALAEGRIPWPTARAATDPHWQQIIATAFQADPNLDETAHARRRQAVTQFTGNGSAARTIGSAERLAHHLNDLNTASERLPGPNLGMGWANTAAAAIGQQFDPTDATTYDTAVDHVSSELTRYFRQAGGSNADIERSINELGRHQSLDQRRAAIREVISLIGGAIQPLQQQYNDAFTPGSPRPHVTWLSPEARRIYGELGGVDFNLGPDGNPRSDAAAPAAGAQPPAPGAPGAAPPNGPGQAGPSDPNAPPPPDPHFAANLASAAPGSYERFQALEQYHNARQHGGGAVSTIGFGDQPESEWQDSYGITEPQAQDFEREYQAQLPHWTQARQVADQVSAANGGDPGFGQRGREGWTQGLNDELSGAGMAIGNAIQAPFAGNFDPAGAYQTGRDAERIRNSQAQDATGAAGTALEVGTSIVGAAPALALSAPAEAASLGGRMVAGARAGLPIGAASGWAHGEGLGDSTRGALVGGAEGGAIGAVAPLAGSVGRGAGRAVRGAYRTVMGENPDLSRRIVSEAIAADNPGNLNPIARVSGQMADAHANGVPGILADTGDNVRGLLAANARRAGPARTLARDALDARQNGMAERVTGAIERDLGPVSNPHEVADQLMTQARDTAGPLYDAAYARPGADTFAQRVAPLLSRPSMQRALQRASRIAQEEGRDPTTTGFDVNSSGEVTVSRTPSWQTLDYVKRGMDDVIESYRDPTSGRLNLDTEGRAINNTQRSFLSAFDQANPDYAAARSAYAGPVRGIDAMNQGRQALSMTADDLEARMRDMSPYERQMFQLGTRRAMAELVASKGDTADVVHALTGTGKKRAMLARLFGSRQDFQRFVDTLGHEQEAFRTFRTARLGSPTAANLQDDNALADAVTEGGASLLTGGHGMLRAAARFVTSAGRRRINDNTAQEITALLSESDPARLRQLASELRQEQARQASLTARRARNARVGGVVAGEVAGRR